MSLVEADLNLSSEDRRLLLDAALASIAGGLESGRYCDISAEDYPETLRDVRATFVTLRIEGRLRGCMGALEPVDPVVVDVARNAYSAAFRDPRFAGLGREEFERVRVSISILSTFEPLAASSERELVERLRPGIDGLIVYEGKRRGTLLPAVWSNLPDPREFLVHLRRKAGLADDHWSPSIRFARYTAWSIED
jgi:AmmeMemoRadiSam system protein A